MIEKQIEKSVITFIEVKFVLEDNKKPLDERLMNKQLGNQTGQVYNEQNNDGTIKRKQFDNFDSEVEVFLPQQSNTLNSELSQ